MFARIVSQLSLTPQAAAQLTAYARRLRRQRAQRALITILAGLLLILQLVSFAWPARASSGKVPKLAAGSAARQIESASRTLPVLGRGWDLGIMAIICLLALWSQIRYRQLAREVSILRGDYVGGKS